MSATVITALYSSADPAEGHANNVVTSVAGASAHLKGAWATAIEALPEACEGFSYTHIGSGGSGVRSLIDIGIGPLGDEEVLVPNISSAIGTIQRANVQRVVFPIPLESGTRIAVRHQSSTANIQRQQHLMAWAGGPCGYGASALAYGVDLLTSRGTEIDPGGTPFTKGAWTEVVASTTDAAVQVYVFQTNQGRTSQVSCAGSWDLAVGPLGDEEIVIPDAPTIADGNRQFLGPWCITRALAIPAGSRLSARSQSSIATSPDRKIDLSVVLLAAPEA